MKIIKKNNDDKLDLIINKISNIQTRIDILKECVDNRFNKLEACPTIINELQNLS